MKTVSLIRPMQVDDLEMVLGWRNHADVRKMMFSTHIITMSEHRRWFESICRKSNIHTLIYEEESSPVGFVNFTSGRVATVADWGFYLNPKAIKGTGQRLGSAALNYAFHSLNLHKLCGQALSFNQRSIRFHRALGFADEGCLREQHFDGEIYHDILCFGMLKTEWQAKQEKEYK